MFDVRYMHVGVSSRFSALAYGKSGGEAQVKNPSTYNPYVRAL